jgi:hypothetical protein
VSAVWRRLTLQQPERLEICLLGSSGRAQRVSNADGSISSVAAADGDINVHWWAVDDAEPPGPADTEPAG